MLSILRELYDVYLTGADAAKYRLIERYWKLLPYKYICEYNALKIKGKEQSNDRFRSLIFRYKSFLAMIPKDTSTGSYYPIPLVIDHTNDENADSSEYDDD